MKIFDRIKNAFSRKESLTVGVIGAAAGGNTIWTPVGYENYARETYLKNVTAFRAIDEVAKSVASVPWRQYRRHADGELEAVNNDGIAGVIERPNPDESFSYVILKAVAYLCMDGNAFIERVMQKSGPNRGRVAEMYALRPDRMKIIIGPTTGRIAAYKYSVGGNSVEFPVDPVTSTADVLQLKTFHPTDDWWGAAATESAAREIDTSNAAVTWNKSLLDNQGRPGMIYTLVGNVGQTQLDNLERYLRQAHAGPGNVGKDLILTGERGTGAQPYGWSPTDMDFGEGEYRVMRKIAMTYGVPPMLLGIPGEATFANYKEARLAFWETTVFWWLNYLRGEFNNWLFEKESGLYLDYVLDDVPAMSIKRDALWERAQNSDFLTINEKREMVGLETYGEVGGVILVEASKIPLAQVVAGTGGEGGEGEEEDERSAREQLYDQGYDDNEINEILGSDYSDREDEEILGDESKPYPGEHACRLVEPAQFDQFARVNCFKKSDGKCIDYIFGIKDGKSKTQAMRYKSKIWAAADAAKHCAGAKGQFEPAK